MTISRRRFCGAIGASSALGTSSAFGSQFRRSKCELVCCQAENRAASSNRLQHLWAHRLASRTEIGKASRCQRSDGNATGDGVGDS